jgi:hypothetical protein
MHPASTLPIPAQVAGLRSLFPVGKTRWTRNSVNWKGTLSPSAQGRLYGLELNYRLGEPPDVWVKSPNLKDLADGRSLPHVYSQEEQRLCLYVPGRKLWTPRKSVAATLLPWAALWLYYFELWLVTDEWLGLGEHPQMDDCNEKPKEP